MSDGTAKRAYYVVLAALAVAMLGALWCVPYLPTNDGPNHILSGYVEANLDSAKGYDTFLERSFPLTNQGFHIPFSLLVQVLPWRDATRVMLSLGALLWAGGFAALVYALEPRRLPLAALGVATALSWPLYMGFFVFWITSGLALFVIAFAVHARPWRWRQRLILGGATLIVAFGHVFVAEVLGLILFALVFARSAHEQPSWRQRLSDVGGLALVGLPSLMLALLAARGAGDVYRQDYGDDPFRPTWLSAIEAVQTPWHCFAGGPWWRGIPPVLLALGGIGFCLWRFRQRAGHERALTICALSFLVLSQALPFHVEAWKFLAPRFLPFAIVLGLVLLPLERFGRRGGQAARLVLPVFALSAIGWSVTHHRALYAAEADALSGISAPLQRRGMRLPLKLTAPHGGTAFGWPGVNIGLLYAIEQGGMVPYLFATRRGISPLVYVKPRRELFPPFPGRFAGIGFRRAGTTPEFPPKPVQYAWLSQLASRYEDVILIGEPADVEAFASRGFIADYQQRGTAVLRYQGCGFDLTIQAETPPAHPTLVEYGWAPVLTPYDGLGIPPNALSQDITLRFDAAPCGAIWWRVAVDRDGSGGFTPGDLICAGADELGRRFESAKRPIGRLAATCRL